MAKERFGKLPAVHALLLNPHAATKLSRCPHCDGLTYPRKLAFLLHVEGWGPLVHGKMCKYCARCRLILAQQDDLEEQLRQTFAELAPQVLGNTYLVLGVVESKVFKASLARPPQEIQALLEHVSGIRKYYGLGFSPGGWFKDGEQPTWPAHREERIPREPGQWGCWGGAWKFYTEVELAQRRRESATR